MNDLDIQNLIRKGESSSVQFKERLPHQDSIAQEMIAFSNSEGGMIIIGVNDKTGTLHGLTYNEIQEVNNKLVSIASQQIFPSIIIKTETVDALGAYIVVVTIREGISKPYKDRLGSIYLKNGSDNRRVTSNDEISRLLQSSKLMFADELPINGATISALDIGYYEKFIQKKYNMSLMDLGVDLNQSLRNLNLLKDDTLTLAGLLFFSTQRSTYRPLFSIQCVSVHSVSLITSDFDDYALPMEGTLRQVFDQAISFVDRNLKKVPEGPGFNSQAIWEIPYVVFEELLVNALIHRDYFTNATIKVCIFPDRIEIISPGKLPNSLRIENIKNGVSLSRNPLLQSLAQHVLPYKGLGTGIMRALSQYPTIEFTNDLENNRFIATIPRRG